MLNFIVTTENVMFTQKYYRLLLGLGFLLLPLHLLAEQQQISLESMCNSKPPYFNYNFTQQELDSLLKQLLPLHREWLKESKNLEQAGELIDYQDRRRINLCGANLQGLNLSRKNLSMANLMYAELQNANLTASNLSRIWLDGASLQKAQLIKANLSQAYLYNVVFEEANLVRANLTEAEASNVNFTGAELVEANLSKAILHEANLTRANLFYAILSDSDFSNANLSESTFYPKVNSYPDPLSLVPTFHHRDELFKDVQYYDTHAGSPVLASLRAAYRKSGMRETERIITNLLQLQIQEQNWKQGGWERVGSVLSYILFNLTSAYGLEPQRPLSLLVDSILLFAFIYWIALRIDSKHNYFEVVWESNVLTSSGRRGIKKGGHGLDAYHPLRFKRCCGDSWFKQLLLEFKMLRISLYFSVLSAFHIGWKQYNVGVWIKQLQPREFSLRVRKGWMRSISGFQSLLSIYLMVIWILTQFGRPFD
ncbi:pentapeptide repeat-containing protein [Candidatus Albibeggiatoa sp. nov. BB20]|uniref:pentapeptide repeat-containing protein n=1 Tax=Candidatus Albibeggiatoa sp. nov. BB20 TaxID=3162723 RepID=UPI00336553F2